MIVQLNFDVTKLSVNGRKYSPSSLSKQVRTMIKEKRLFITRKTKGEKPIKKSNNLFFTLDSTK